MSGAQILKRRPESETPFSQGLIEHASSAGLEANLSNLDQLSVSEMRDRYRELFDRNAPPRLGVDLMRSAIAFHLQELSRGGLSRQARLRLKALMGQSDKSNGSRSVVNTNAIIKPGTSLVREWQNESHEVHAIDTGDFVYRGRTFRSLSVIACEITGTHQSGPRFFGLRKVAAREQLNG